MIRTCNCPTYFRSPSSCSVTHADPKRSRVISSHYQEFTFNYINFNMIMFLCLNHANS